MLLLSSLPLACLLTAFDISCVKFSFPSHHLSRIFKLQLSYQCFQQQSGFISFTARDFLGIQDIFSNFLQHYASKESHFSSSSLSDGPAFTAKHCPLEGGAFNAANSCWHRDDYIKHSNKHLAVSKRVKVGRSGMQIATPPQKERNLLVG